VIPIRDDHDTRQTPYVTRTILILLVVIYFWDRGGSLFGRPYVFADLAARPADIWAALKGGGSDPLVTLFTSMFLHGNLAHILGNLLFLAVFGPRIEAVYGAPRYALYYIFFGVAATMTHAVVMPDSTVSLVGASGAIAGVMGVYFMLFPGAWIQCVILPFWFVPFVLPAWLMLGLWFLMQLFVVQPGVATWAHVGGFLAGMGVALVVGKKPMSARHDVARTDW